MRACWSCKVIALSFVLFCAVSGRVVERSKDDNDEFMLGPDLVDYSSIEDSERPYTLNKLIYGEGVTVDYGEDETTDVVTTEPPSSNQNDEMSNDEEARFEIDPETQDIQSDDGLPDEEEIEEHFSIYSNSSVGQGRILNPTAAVSGQFPYYVYIKATQKDGTTVIPCGGALLSDTWVVTAAQCVATAASIQVIAGIIASTATTPMSTGVTIIHPGYRKNFLVHDIALVRLLSPFTLGSTIYPVKLPKTDKVANLDNVSVRTVGFGPVDDTKVLVTPLNYVDLVGLNKGTCNSITNEVWVSYPGNTACMSTSTSTKGFCYGDTGGPVIYTFPSDLAPTLLGVNSQFQSCPSAYPMAYTRTGPYLSWIKSIVKKLLT